MRKINISKIKRKCSKWLNSISEAILTVSTDFKKHFTTPTLSCNEESLTELTISSMTFWTDSMLHRNNCKISHRNRQWVVAPLTDECQIIKMLGENLKFWNFHWNNTESPNRSKCIRCTQKQNKKEWEPSLKWTKASEVISHGMRNSDTQIHSAVDFYVCVPVVLTIQSKLKPRGSYSFCVYKTALKYTRTYTHVWRIHTFTGNEWNLTKKKWVLSIWCVQSQ